MTFETKSGYSYKRYDAPSQSRIYTSGGATDAVGYYRVLAGLEELAPYQETKPPAFNKVGGFLVSVHSMRGISTAENLTVNQGYVSSTLTCAANIDGE